MHDAGELKIDRSDEEQFFHPRAFIYGEEQKGALERWQKVQADASSTYNHPDVETIETETEIENETSDMNHLKHLHGERHRRSYSLKSKCFPSSVKKCKIFTVGGITKLYCVYVKKLLCVALD